MKKPINRSCRSLCRFVLFHGSLGPSSKSQVPTLKQQVEDLKEAVLMLQNE